MDLIQKEKILENCRQMFKNTLMQTLDIEIVDITEDYVLGKMPVTSKVHQPDGVLHGGATVALAETIGSMASFLLSNSTDFVIRGIEISANHLKSVREGFVYAKASAIHKGKTTQLWEIKITDEEDNLISLVKLTTIALPKKKLMSSEDFFNLLEDHIESGNPMVSYRLPGHKSIQMLSQTSKSIFRIKDYSENGFVFAPFQGIELPLFIPEDEAVKTILPQFEIKAQIISKDKWNSDEESNHEAKEKHINLVAFGVQAILEGDLKKVVLSRKELQKTTISAAEIFQNLLSLYSNAFVYIWNHPETGIWMGATPETLLRTERSKFVTMALAGTRKLQEISGNNWTYKELEEQQIVTDSIVFSLKELGYREEELTVSETYSSEAGSLLHLRTDISGVMKQGSIEIGPIIKALHPTPAVCGLPKNEAFKFINGHEKYDREYYTGFLGPLNMTTEIKRNSRTRNQENQAYASIRKDTSLFVNLRCMKYNEGKVTIYVGGGITKDSNAKAEWEETKNKTRTMKAAL